MNQELKEYLSDFGRNILEAGYIVSDYSEYVYKIDSVILVDDKLQTKTVSIHDSIELKKYNPFIFDVSEYDTNGFWLDDFDYYILRTRYFYLFNSCLDSHVDDFIQHKGTEFNTRINDVYILGTNEDRTYFRVMPLKFVAVYKNNIKYKPNLPVFRSILNDGLDIYYLYDKFEARFNQIGLDYKFTRFNYFYITFSYDYNTNYYTFNYKEIDKNDSYKTRYDFNFDSITYTSIFAELPNGDYSIKQDVESAFLILPSNCKYLSGYGSNNSVNLSNIEAVIIPKSFIKFIWRSSGFFFEFTKNIREIYFPVSFSLDRIISILKDNFTNKIKDKLLRLDDATNLDERNDILQDITKRCIVIKQY